mmetsp:Transcript_33686/g.49303  ORF Transcript_33686/g.49303 Transcript_33686/m.49303 type:complete len:211 (+) Transcript_33686:501-1133(+)
MGSEHCSISFSSSSSFSMCSAALANINKGHVADEVCAKSSMSSSSKSVPTNLKPDSDSAAVCCSWTFLKRRCSNGSSSSELSSMSLNSCPSPSTISSCFSSSSIYSHISSTPPTCSPSLSSISSSSTFSSSSSLLNSCSKKTPLPLMSAASRIVWASFASNTKPSFSSFFLRLDSSLPDLYSTRMFVTQYPRLRNLRGRCFCGGQAWPYM